MSKHPGHRDADQAHDHAHGANERSVATAAVLTGSFMLAEVAGGIVSGSLALLADAGHMLTDFASLALAWYGFVLARRPADWKRSYGYDRFSILIAFANGLALFAISAWIIWEAGTRLTDPVEIAGGLMLSVAAAGLVVNILAFWALQSGDTKNLNVRAAAIHVVGDLLGSVAAIVAACVILLTGWTPIDPLLSVLVAVIILQSAWRVVKSSAHILLEGTPRGIDTREIAIDLQNAIPGIEDVHHIHAWSITQERPMITLHAKINDQSAPEIHTSAIKQRLKERFGFDHATVEIERTLCADDVKPF